MKEGHVVVSVVVKGALGKKKGAGPGDEEIWHSPTCRNNTTEISKHRDPAYLWLHFETAMGMNWLVGACSSVH